MNLEKIFIVSLDQLPFLVLALIFAFTVHEFAHAYVAYKFGDDTAKNEGRVTLNPAMHIDFLGFILILIAGFGWARPVPVRASNFKKPRQMSIIVSLAGPLSNFILGVISVFTVIILHQTGVLYSGSLQVTNAVELFFKYMITYNFLLFVFNLIPLPPLDGYRIAVEFLPLRQRMAVERNSHWGVIFFLLMVFIKPLRELILYPIFNLSKDIMDTVIKLAHMIM